MKIDLTLRSRLILTFALLSVAVAATLGIFTSILMEVSEEKLIQKTIVQEAKMLAENFAEFPDSAGKHKHEEHFILYVEGPDRKDALPEAVERIGKRSGELVMDGKEYESIYIKEGPYDFYFLFDFSQYEIFEFTVSFMVLIAVCFAAILGIWLGFLTSNKILSPVVRLANIFDQETDSDIGIVEVPKDFADDEVGLLANKFSQYNKRIESLIEREKAFTANASHELRNPIFAIAGAAEVLESSPSLHKDDKQTVSRIRREANAMREKVDLFLALARGSEQFGDEDEIDVTAVLNDQLKELETVCREKGIDLTVTLNRNPIVQGSRQAFSIILQNILNNAVQYTNKGGISVSVDAGRIVIEDTGIGISREIKEKVFERFFRDSTSTPGAGIGLSLVRELCDICGWRISLEEAAYANTGTRVVFSWS